MIISIIITIKITNAIATPAPLEAMLTWEPPQVQLPVQGLISDLGKIDRVFLQATDFTKQRKKLNIPDDWEIGPYSPIRPYTQLKDVEILRNLPIPQNLEKKLVLGILQFLTYYWKGSIDQHVTFIYLGIMGKQWNAIKQIIKFFAANHPRFAKWKWLVLLASKLKVAKESFSGYDVKLVKSISNQDVDDIFARAHGQKILISNYTYYRGDKSISENLQTTLQMHRGWIEKHRPDLSMIRFHLPYSFSREQNFQFFTGRLLKNFYNKYNTVDLRIIVPREATLTNYNNQKIEQQMFYYNYDQRYLSEYEYGNYPVPPEFLTYKFDSVSEVIIMYGFMEKFFIPPNLDNFVALENYFFSI